MINCYAQSRIKRGCFIVLFIFLSGTNHSVFGVCNLPTGLTTTNIGANSAQCNWAATVSDSFLLRYNVVGTTNYLYKKISIGTATNVIITGLAPLTNYQWVIHTYCSGGASGAYQATPSPFTTAPGPPTCAKPTGLTQSTITHNSAKLIWSATTCDSLLVRYNVTGSTVYSYVTVKPGSATSVTVNGLYPLTNYQWVVHTYCNNGSSGAYQTTPSTFTTMNGPMTCVIPNNLANSNIGTNSATISWNAAIISDSFLVRYAPHNWTIYTWVKIPGSQHSLTLQYLNPNWQYDWCVRSVCASAPLQAYSATNTFSTVANTCGMTDPSYFGSSSIGYNTAIVNWAPVTGALSYNVRYSVKNANTWITLSTTSNSRQLTGLQPNTWYDFQVQVVCSNGGGQWSTSGIFQTTGLGLTLTRGPYLNLSTTSSIYIRWRTSFSSNSRVRYGTTAGSLTSLKDDGAYTSEHIVQLTGLAANTKYFYSVGSTSATLQGDTGNYFFTNPIVGSTGPVRIWTIGDFGTGNAGQTQVRDAYMNYPGAANTNLWLWVGDNAYGDGTDPEYSNNVFGKYPYQMKKWVIWPATGNHDLHSANAFSQTGPYFDNFTLPKNGEAGGKPSGTEAYYSFNYANIHFVCLESTDWAFRQPKPAGAMANWLDSDLVASTQRWKIVYFHHPPYSKGSHNSDSESELIEMRTNIAPILEQNKVDLVLCGHSHSYERSMLLKGHYQSEANWLPSYALNSGSGTFPASYMKTSPNYDGTVYVVCGVSGQLGSTTSGWPHAAMYTSSVAQFGSLVIDVVGDRLDCKMLTHWGGIFDQFTIQKSGVPSPLRMDDSNPSMQAGESLDIYPNPMNTESNIHYVLDKNSNVRMEITDLTGRKLYTLMDGEQLKGEYDIKLSTDDAALSSGVYFLRLIADDETYLKKFVVGGN